MGKVNWKISPEIEGKYEVVNTSFPILESRIGRVDLRKITLREAERIVELGSRYLRKIPARKDKKEMV